MFARMRGLRAKVLLLLPACTQCCEPWCETAPCSGRGAPRPPRPASPPGLGGLGGRGPLAGEACAASSRYLEDVRWEANQFLGEMLPKDIMRERGRTRGLPSGGWSREDTILWTI